MLTSEIKKQILEEEIYRKEIRKEISSKEDGKSKLWLFLNSSFGIWLLSTVVLGLISLGYTNMREKSREGEINRKEIEMYSREIAARLNNYKLSLLKAITIENYMSANKSFISPIEYSFVQEQYKDKNFKALLLEIKSLDLEREMSIQSAIEGFDEIKKTIIEREMTKGGASSILSTEYKDNIGTILNTLSKSFDL